MTAEGRLAVACMERPGLWFRAGLDGIVSGLDRAAARGGVPAGADSDGVEALLDAVEQGFMAGLGEAREQVKPQGK
jgi:hypothetical protein